MLCPSMKKNKFVMPDAQMLLLATTMLLRLWTMVHA